MEGRQPPADEGLPVVGGATVPLARDGRGPGPLVSFLFADIRGFTRFTERHGAEAAVRLANTFIALASEVVEARGGTVCGTWGDQVLAQFRSPREALRAAVELQQRCVEATVRDPSVPLAIGVGLDMGEPADVGATQSAPALNVGARLCASAAAGEVLATAELVHLAGAIQGLSYVDRGSRRLKGLTVAVRVASVRAAQVDRVQASRFQAVLAGERSRRRDPRMWVAALVVLALVAGLTGWAISERGGDPTVTVPSGGVAIVDGSAGRLVDAAEAGGSPEGVAVNDEGLWVAQSSAGSVLRIDRETKRVVQTVPVGSTPVAIALTGQDVWVVNSRDGSVSRVSATTNREIDRVRAVGNQPVAIAAGFGSLWVANQADAEVSRINARTGDLDHTKVQVGRHPGGIAVGAGSVWVTNSGDDTVSRIDPRTMVAETIRVGAGPKGIAVARSGVWVANRNGLSVSHIDPSGRRGVAQIPVGDSPFAVVADDDAVWVGVGADGLLVRIDPARDAVSRSVPLGASPYGLAMVGSEVWAATRPFVSARHFGGTLRVATDQVPGTLDPALLYDYRYQAVIYGGLFGFRRAGGLDNLDLVPNLALAMTTPTDGGRTYSFRLRPGVRYSDGRTVVPADFRRGLERQFSATKGRHPDGEAGAVDYYLNIVGAAACHTATTGPCDLSSGIVTDESRVTFHLVKPDPEFPFKLAQPFASPAPPGTSSAPATGGIVPGVGPYAVADFVPGTSLRLVRNRYFRSRSAAVQPTGYPAAITWQRMRADRQIAAAEAGQVDIVDLFSVSTAAGRDVALRLPAQIHPDPRLNSIWLSLDTSRSPFNRLAARRALSLALDRRHFTTAIGQSSENVACGLPPPGFPGYEPSCTEFTGTASQDWLGTDLRRARRLVAGSGTRGAVVEVYWWKALSAALGRDLTRLLERLGYDARLHLVNEAVYGAERPRAHATTYGWYADYPAASNYYNTYLSCPAVNVSRHCNPGLDALAARAIAVEPADPGESDRLWRRVYRTVNDQALVIPLMHLGDRILVSRRVGNYQHGAYLGPLYEQMWVR